MGYYRGFVAGFGFALVLLSVVLAVYNSTVSLALDRFFSLGDKAELANLYDFVHGVSGTIGYVLFFGILLGLAGSLSEIRQRLRGKRT